MPILIRSKGGQKFKRRTRLQDLGLTNIKAIWMKLQLAGTAHFKHKKESGGMRRSLRKGVKL